MHTLRGARRRSKTHQTLVPTAGAAIERALVLQRELQLARLFIGGYFSERFFFFFF